MTSLKIEPYVSYEGFINAFDPGSGGGYNSETEMGFSFVPLKDLKISLADQIQKQFASEIGVAHQITCNVNYSLDCSKIFK